MCLERRARADGLLLFLLAYPEALESNGTEQTRLSCDTVNLRVFCELSLTPMSSLLQLAGELQNKPLSSEMRELLKLLSKPNVKVRAHCTFSKVAAHGACDQGTSCLHLQVHAHSNSVQCPDTPNHSEEKELNFLKIMMTNLNCTGL